MIKRMPALLLSLALALPAAIPLPAAAPAIGPARPAGTASGVAWLLARQELRLYAVRSPSVRGALMQAEFGVQQLIIEAIATALESQHASLALPLDRALALLDAYGERLAMEAMLGWGKASSPSGLTASDTRQASGPPNERSSTKTLTRPVPSSVPATAIQRWSPANAWACQELTPRGSASRSCSSQGLRISPRHTVLARPDNSSRQGRVFFIVEWEGNCVSRCHGEKRG